MCCRDCFRCKPKHLYIQAKMSSFPAGFLGPFLDLYGASTMAYKFLRWIDKRPSSDRQLLPSDITWSSWTSPFPAVVSPFKRCEHQLHMVSFMGIVLFVRTEARSMKLSKVVTQGIMATKNKLIGKIQVVSDPIFYVCREGTMML